MNLSIQGVRAFDDNYIWLVGAPGSDRVAVVDPGDADPVIEALAADGRTLSAILITHLHGDHTGGVRELLTRFPVPVYGPKDKRIAVVDHPVGEGDCIDLGEGVSFRVLDTPGHTRYHVCYIGEGILFSGDTLFTGGCGKLFEGTPEQMHASLGKLEALPDDTQVYCAHEYTQANLAFARVAEPDNAAIADREAETRTRRQQDEATVPATLGLERQTNPFLRADTPELWVAAEQFAGRKLRSAAEVFAVVRGWKDSLD